MSELGPEILSPPEYRNRIEAEAAWFEEQALQAGSGFQWTACEQPKNRLEEGSLAGLERNEFTPRGQYLVGDASRHWILPLYGIRVKNGPDARPSDVAQFERVPLETTIALHAHLATVLADEQPRPSMLVKPRHPGQFYKGSNPQAVRENNLDWLYCLTEWDVWPVMLAEERGYLTPWSHDHTGAHNATSLLFPREIQGLITAVGRCERHWLKGHPDPSERVIALPGDEEVCGGKDPFGFSWNKSYRDGMDLTDKLTDTGDYIYLLHYLMHGSGNSPEERLQTLTLSGPQSIHRPSELGLAHQGLVEMDNYIGAMYNFVTRNERGRNATVDEVTMYRAQFREGVVRVANTLITL